MPISELAPWDGNPRKISDAALAGLGASIARFGCVEPIVWNRRTGRVVGGHQRLNVLKAQGVVETDVVVVDLAEVEERALNVALNNPHIAGEWTPDVRALLKELSSGFDGFKEIRLDALLEQLGRKNLRDGIDTGRIDEDQAVEPPDKPTTRVGDLWCLGPHRILCGDATDPDVVARLTEGGLADALFTDPPYGVDYCPAERGASRGRNERTVPERTCGRSARRGHAESTTGRFGQTARQSAHLDVGNRHDAQSAGRSGQTARQRAHVDVHDEHRGRRNGHSAAPARGRILNDALPEGQFRDLLCHSFAAADDVLKPGAPIYICGPAGWEARHFWAAWPEDLWHFQAALVWDKGRFALSRWDYHPQHEIVFYGWKRGASRTWLGKRDQASVLEMEMGNGRGYIHPTQKPVGLVRRALLNSAPEGGVVLDLFGGSGSTLIAAETCGRRACLVELDPRFVDAAVRRWELYTGGSKGKREKRR
ncbi:MAG: DNA modification methylase [Deltaproteobacteria bacterium]|nr:DNA modification methylase [Deltaproteobacteria bacterium]